MILALNLFLLIQLVDMDGKPFWHKLIFSPITWGILLGGIYITALWWLGGLTTRENIDLFLADIIFFIIASAWWIFFFAQFILPVRTNKDRIKIFLRLLSRFFSGSSGPALFIENGKLVEKNNESKKTGPGVIVLDTASAVVLKKFSQYTRTVGPGVIFTKKGEVIAGKPVPLHKLIDSAGPREKEDPFAQKSEAKGPKVYIETQKRRLETSALTRDGIEIVPNISVVFKIDANPAKGKDAGSRFGFDKEAVRKAVWHTSVNITPDAHRTVEWHQLPVSIAVDLWREYLGKFRFDELFQATQNIPIKEEKSTEEKEKIQESSPKVSSADYGFRGLLCDILNNINKILFDLSQSIDNRISPPVQDEEKSIETPKSSSLKKISQEKETALQSIKRLINQRMKEESYPVIDRYGKSKNSTTRESAEYKLLTEERGIRILSISINNLRFAPELEKGLLENWSTTWLKNAKDEKNFIEGQHKLRERKGQEKALLEYAHSLSKELLRTESKTPATALKTLLQATRREIIRNPQLHKNAGKEITQLTDMILWIDKEEGSRAI